MLNAVLNEDTGEIMEYQHLIGNPKYREIWGQAYGNEVGRLAQGMEGRVKGTNTIFSNSKEDLPAERWKDVTYGHIVVNYCPEIATPTGSDSPLAAIASTAPATTELPLPT